MNINNIHTLAEKFSLLIENELEGSEDDDLKSEIHSLFLEIIQCADTNSTDSCNLMVKKIKELRYITNLFISDWKFDDQYSELTKFAMSSVIHAGMLEEQAASSWLDKFFNLNVHIKNELLKDPQILQKLQAVILEVGPNFLIDPQAEITLFMCLCDDDNSIVRKFALDLLENNSVEVNKATLKGNTPLHAAAINDDGDLIHSLLSKGADPAFSNKVGKIPFDVAKTKETLIEAIPLEKIIEGEPFVTRVLNQIKSAKTPSDSIIFKFLAGYFKSQTFDTETLKRLTFDWNTDILSGLLENGILFDNIPADTIKSLFDKALSLNTSYQLQTLLNSERWFFIFDEIKGQDNFTLIESSPHASRVEMELQKAKNQFDGEAFKAYQSLAKNMVPVGVARRAIKMESIDQDFQVLIDKKIPGAKKAKNDFDADPNNRTQREKLAKALEIFEEQKPAALKARAAIDMDLEIVSILKHLAWTKNDIELLTEIERFFSPTHLLVSPTQSDEMTAMNKIIANVALDKMYFSKKKTYEAGFHHWVAPYFAHALQITEEKLKEQNIPKKLETKGILKQCVAELQEMSRWAYYNVLSLYLEPDTDSNRLLQSTELVNKINSLSPGESCLVPITVMGDIAGHATLMRIENTGIGKVRILFYNTGRGVRRYHPEGTKANTFQTFIEYADVPTKNLQNPKDWDILIGMKMATMPPVYEMLERLCKGGTKEPPSRHQEYYEATQKSGSCAYQCFLAMIRERLVTAVPDPAEGLALYKIVKGVMLNAFEERTRGLRNEQINAQFQSKLKVVGAELSIANALADPMKKETLSKELAAELKSQNLISMAEEVEEKAFASPLRLYTTIRKAISELAALDTPLTRSGLISDAVLLNREKENLNKKGYNEMLNEFLSDNGPKNIEAWAKAFGAQFLGGAYQKTATEWAVKELNQVPSGPYDTKPRAALLNRLIKGINRIDIDQREKLLAPLIEGFKLKGNQKMADYLQATCLTVDKQKGDSDFEY